MRLVLGVLPMQVTNTVNMVIASKSKNSLRMAHLPFLKRCPPTRAKTSTKQIARVAPEHPYWQIWSDYTITSLICQAPDCG